MNSHPVQRQKQGTVNRKSKIKNQKSTTFLAGVIEGFYGEPWSQLERFELFEWMSNSGLNTYLYAPKDDLKHRSHWRQLYATDEEGRLVELIRACRKYGVRFIYALSPGLDIRYSDEGELEVLKAKLAQLIALGCRDFALLFDDIPDVMAPADRKQGGSFASLHSRITNTIYQWLRGLTPEGRFLFCPTPYCGRMAERNLGGADYLGTIGRELLPEIDVLWTGPEIISREISLAHLEKVRSKLRRPPVLWDNLHANDYDGRRFYCGPYSGRPTEIKVAVNGILANPNCEFPLNFVPLRTLADFVGQKGHWEPRKAYLVAIKQWLQRFATSGPPLTLEDLVLLGDCHYLPYEEGPEAERLYQQVWRLIATDPADWGKNAAAFQERATRLRDCCTRLAELCDRPLFYALSRRLWELREELDLLLGWIQLRREKRETGTSWCSDFHLPNTYRGGLLRRLERLLTQQPDGTFTPAQRGAELSRSPRRRQTQTAERKRRRLKT